MVNKHYIPAKTAIHRQALMPHAAGYESIGRLWDGFRSVVHDVADQTDLFRRSVPHHLWHLYIQDDFFLLLYVLYWRGRPPETQADWEGYSARCSIGFTEVFVRPWPQLENDLENNIDNLLSLNPDSHPLCPAADDGGGSFRWLMRRLGYVPVAYYLEKYHLRFARSVGKRLDEHRETVEDIERDSGFFQKNLQAVRIMRAVDDYLVQLFSLYWGFEPDTDLPYGRKPAGLAEPYHEVSIRPLPRIL